MSELTVILKDEHRTYRQKFLMYADYKVSIHDPDVINCILEAKKNFEGDPDTITLKINMMVQ